jgi:hypothetical protein
VFAVAGGQTSRIGLGVTEFWPILFPVGGDPAGSRRETRALLAGLAAAS